MDERNDIGGSWSLPPAPQQDELLSRGVERCPVTDAKRTIVSQGERHSLDPDVEADALMSSEADERSCFRSNGCFAVSPSPLKALQDTSGSGLQESVSTTTESVYCASTAGRGRSSAGETVMLMSTGAATGSWNNTVVLPVDDLRTSIAHRSPPLLAAASPQTQTSGEHSAMSELVRENAMLQQVNVKQAETIHRLTTEMARTRDMPRLSSDVERHSSSEENSIVQLLKEQIAVYKEDFNNERRDKERALSEKDSLMKQTTTLLNDLKALQERNTQLEAALRIARQNMMSSDDAERRRPASRWAD